MPKLIEQILKRNNKDVKIELALCDGSYDSNENFKYLQKKWIRSAIKVRKNSIISSKKQQCKK
jgi:phosphatidate phosphatase PAH1